MSILTREKNPPGKRLLTRSSFLAVPGTWYHFDNGEEKYADKVHVKQP